MVVTGLTTSKERGAEGRNPALARVAAISIFVREINPELEFHILNGFRLWKLAELEQFSDGVEVATFFIIQINADMRRHDGYRRVRNPQSGGFSLQRKYSLRRCKCRTVNRAGDRCIFCCHNIPP